MCLAKKSAVSLTFGAVNKPSSNSPFICRSSTKSNNLQMPLLLQNVDTVCREQIRFVFLILDQKRRGGRLGEEKSKSGFDAFEHVVVESQHRS